VTLLLHMPLYETRRAALPPAAVHVQNLDRDAAPTPDCDHTTHTPLVPAARLQQPGVNTWSAALRFQGSYLSPAM